MEVEPEGSAPPPSSGAKPSRRPVLAGALAFLGSLGLGLALTVLVVRAIPPKVPNPTEAYEGFGDAVMASFELAVGAALSLVVSMIFAAAVAARVAGRGRGSAP